MCIRDRIEHPTPAARLVDEKYLVDVRMPAHERRRARLQYPRDLRGGIVALERRDHGEHMNGVANGAHHHDADAALHVAACHRESSISSSALLSIASRSASSIGSPWMRRHFTADRESRRKFAASTLCLPGVSSHTRSTSSAYASMPPKPLSAMRIFLMLRSGWRAPAILSDASSFPVAAMSECFESLRESAPSAAARSRLLGTSRVTTSARRNIAPAGYVAYATISGVGTPSRRSVIDSSSSRGARVAPRNLS